MSNLDKVYFILSYKRPKALGECLRTVFSNTKKQPDLVYILDDNSGEPHQNSLIEFSRDVNRNICPVNLILNSSNLGVGSQFQTIYRLIEQLNPKIAYIIEGDYYLRNEWGEDVDDVFELLPNTIAIPLMDHVDMRIKHKTQETFRDIMTQYFGEDIETARRHMYNFEVPSILKTPRGDMQYFGVTNSCGAQILHWERIQQMIKDTSFQLKYWEVLNSCFHENGNRQRASDGGMSCVHSYLFNRWALNNGVDIRKEFGYINILPSLSYHAASQGLNGGLDPNMFPDGSSFPGVNSGTFPQDYDNWTRK